VMWVPPPSGAAPTSTSWPQLWKSAPSWHRSFHLEDQRTVGLSKISRHKLSISAHSFWWGRVGRNPGRKPTGYGLTQLQGSDPGLPSSRES
jgi:hypothetical protein